MRCLYCNIEKPIEEFSDEHVITQAIGGNIEPINPFKLTEICQRCNRLCGLFVDGPFIRSWFTQSSRTSFVFKALKPGGSATLPLTYNGVLDDLACESRICELRIGSTGDTVYHFHEPYPTSLTRRQSLTCRRIYLRVR